MQELECELNIGDAIRIDETVYTVIDIEDDEVSFRIDFIEDEPLLAKPAARVAK